MTTLRRERIKKFEDLLVEYKAAPCDYATHPVNIDEWVTGLANKLADAAESRVELVNAGLEWPIVHGQSITLEELQEEKLKTEAPRMFEKALCFSKPLPWWSNKTWNDFAAWVVEQHKKSKTIFGEYNIWRNTQYTKGGMNNQRIRGFPFEFYDSWDMFLMSREPITPTTPAPRSISPLEVPNAIPNPNKVRPNIPRSKSF